MITIFDLDDTLYPEQEYVDSGFRAVAQWGATEFGLPERLSVTVMRQALAESGRGRVFDIWMETAGLRPSRRLVNQAVRVYRHHDPDIHVPEAHLAVLNNLAGNSPLYLVTDGHKVVQAKKIEALGIGHMFAGVYITHRYGYAAAKPSPRCLELIRKREKVEWSQMVYVGDNPSKDFVAPNRLGMLTVRVLTGAFARDVVDIGFDAEEVIHSLEELPGILATTM